MSHTSAEAKKEEFRKYLEKTNVVDALTKVLVNLYEEPDRPEKPLDFIKKALGGPTAADVDQLRNENQQLQAELAALKKKYGEENAQA